METRKKKKNNLMAMISNAKQMYETYHDAVQGDGTEDVKLMKNNFKFSYGFNARNEILTRRDIQGVYCSLQLVFCCAS